jgi:hypothetical protein
MLIFSSSAVIAGYLACLMGSSIWHGFSVLSLPFTCTPVCTHTGTVSDTRATSAAQTLTPERRGVLESESEEFRVQDYVRREGRLGTQHPHTQSLEGNPP